MNIKKIKELVDLMNENGLTEIEVREEGTGIKLVKSPSGVVGQVMGSQATAPAVVTSQETQPAAQTKGNIKEVASPMVGTFYRSPSPETSSYVEVGDVVQKGDVLCIVEAMKLMNEVKAEFSGKIAEICVENAEAVEFGQTLFLVEPAQRV